MAIITDKPLLLAELIESDCILQYDLTRVEPNLSLCSDLCYQIKGVRQWNDFQSLPPHCGLNADGFIKRPPVFIHLIASINQN